MFPWNCSKCLAALPRSSTVFPSALCLQEKFLLVPGHALLIKVWVRLPVLSDERFQGQKWWQESPQGLALTHISFCKQAMPPPPQPPQPKAHLPLLQGTEAQCGPKAACPVPPWGSCVLLMQRLPVLPPWVQLSPHSRKEQTSPSPLILTATLLAPATHTPPTLAPLLQRPTSASTSLTVTETVLHRRSGLHEKMLLWKHLRPPRPLCT